MKKTVRVEVEYVNGTHGIVQGLPILRRETYDVATEAELRDIILKISRSLERELSIPFISGSYVWPIEEIS